MEPCFSTILSKHCRESAKNSAKTICTMAQDSGIDSQLLLGYFQDLLPKTRFELTSDWNEAEKVIAKACFVLEMQHIGRKYEEPVTT